MGIGSQALSLIGLVVLSLALTACGADGEDVPATSPASNAGQEPTVTVAGEIMTIEGKIVTVMESWPLQLAVETQSGRYQVGLLLETTITRRGETVDPGELRPDLRIRVEGRRTGPNAMVAETVEILAESG